MESLLIILSVIALFVLRIGVPVILLIAGGMIIERWQRHRELQIQRYVKSR